MLALSRKRKPGSFNFLGNTNSHGAIGNTIGNSTANTIGDTIGYTIGNSIGNTIGNSKNIDKTCQISG